MIKEMKKIVKKAVVDKNHCVACGVCMKNCPKGAIKVLNGVFAEINELKCIGCGLCKEVCPACVIDIIKKDEVT